MALPVIKNNDNKETIGALLQESNNALHTIESNTSNMFNSADSLATKKSDETASKTNSISIDISKNIEEEEQSLAFENIEEKIGSSNELQGKILGSVSKIYDFIIKPVKTKKVWKEKKKPEKKDKKPVSASLFNYTPNSKIWTPFDSLLDEMDKFKGNGIDLKLPSLKDIIEYLKGKFGKESPNKFPNGIPREKNGKSVPANLPPNKDEKSIPKTEKKTTNQRKTNEEIKGNKELPSTISNPENKEQKQNPNKKEQKQDGNTSKLNDKNTSDSELLKKNNGTNTSVTNDVQNKNNSQNVGKSLDNKEQPKISSPSEKKSETESTHKNSRKKGGKKSSIIASVLGGVGGIIGGSLLFNSDKDDTSEKEKNKNSINNDIKNNATDVLSNAIQDKPEFKDKKPDVPVKNNSTPVVKETKSILNKELSTTTNKTIEKIAENTGESVGEKTLLKTGVKDTGKFGIKKIPLLGALAGVGFGASRLIDGDVVGALGEVTSGLVSSIPGIGTALSMLIDGALAVRDMSKQEDDKKKKEEDKAIRDNYTPEDDEDAIELVKQNYLNTKTADIKNNLEQKKSQLDLEKLSPSVFYNQVADSLKISSPLTAFGDLQNVKTEPLNNKGNLYSEVNKLLPVPSTDFANQIVNIPVNKDYEQIKSSQESVDKLINHSISESPSNDFNTALRDTANNSNQQPIIINNNNYNNVKQGDNITNVLNNSSYSGNGTSFR